MDADAIIEECRKRLRPLKKKFTTITPVQENWFMREWLEARSADDAREKFLKEYQCEWPEQEVL